MTVGAFLCLIVPCNAIFTRKSLHITKNNANFAKNYEIARRIAKNYENMGNSRKILKRLGPDKPKYAFDNGAFRIEFYFTEGNIKKSYLMITTSSGVFSMKLDARNQAFGYLWAAASHGNEDQIFGYATLVCSLARGICADQKLTEDCMTALNNFYDRLLTEAEERAQSVSESEETASQVYMEDVVRRAEMQGDAEAERQASESEQEMLKEAMAELNTEGDADVNTDAVDVAVAGAGAESDNETPEP